MGCDALVAGPGSPALDDPPQTSGPDAASSKDAGTDAFLRD
jgi:hypothetical protein